MIQYIIHNKLFLFINKIDIVITAVLYNKGF